MNVPATSPATLPAEASGPDVEASDARLIEMWVHGRPFNTRRVYQSDLGRFLAFVGGKPLRTITLADLQRFADSLTGAESSRGRVLASVKSILSFAARLGAVPFNVGAAFRRVKARDTLADRIIGEADVAKMLAITEGRDHAFVRLAYAGGFRVAELVSLRWSDLVDAADGTLYVTVFGKGGKTRTVRVSAATGKILRELRADAPLSGHVFAGRSGALDPSQAWRIVRAVARRAGIEKPVSPHFLRHAHASHALDRGAKVSVVRDSLGHSSLAVTDRYLHARPEESSGLVLPV
jgi:integrase/recombinase XerD